MLNPGNDEDLIMIRSKKCIFDAVASNPVYKKE
jgi:hypothetical protein